VGDMIGEDGLPKMFSYVRYHRSYRARDILELEAKYGNAITLLDSVNSIPALVEIGKEYASENVQLEHLI
jgi:hypothetical protein